MKKVILLTDGNSSYARGLLQGISEYSRLHGPWIFYREFLIPFYRKTLKKKALLRLKDWGPDGIITRSRGSANEIIELGLPTVTTDDDEQIPGFPSVVSDYERTGMMAAEHLMGCGLSHYAYCGFDIYSWSQKRKRSFIETLANYGHKCNVYKYPKTRTLQMWENEQDQIIVWLKSLPKPIGIMACNDDRGQQIIDLCRLAGFRIPEDIAVVGVDNDMLLCDLANPQLSSIEINTTRAGYEAARLLDQLIEGGKPKTTKIIARATHVEVRKSTQTIDVNDSEVVTALRFIRENIRDNIQVTDVAEIVALSRRALFDKFKKAVGRSVHKEIKRIRVLEMSKLLRETDLPVFQLALMFNFTSIEHIARYFKTETGMTPLEYRNSHSSGFFSKELFTKK